MEEFEIIAEDQWYQIPIERENNFRKIIGDKRKGRALNTGFFINESDEIRLIGKFLKQNTRGFYHSDYNSGGAWAKRFSIENMIWTFKNDVDTFPERLPFVQSQLEAILTEDLPKILEILQLNKITVCVVPRSKEENYYRNDQLLFRKVISNKVRGMSMFEDGSLYITRHSNTRTTHLDRNGEGGEGNLPYPGITKNTCSISQNVIGKDILLIDDLYTKNINIDEDAIQAILDKGAKSVTFYSVGKTISRI